MDACEGASIVENLLEVVTDTEVARHICFPFARHCALTIVWVVNCFASARNEIECIVCYKLVASALDNVCAHVGIECVGVVAIIVENVS